MKQYTTPDQTAKLIELGFEKPKSIIHYSYPVQIGLDPYLATVDQIEYEFAYSIGELIEMLPKQLDNPYKPPLAMEFNGRWRVYYGVPEDYSWEWSIWYEEERNELIDALFAMCVKLKEEEVI